MTTALTKKTFGDREIEHIGENRADWFTANSISHLSLQKQSTFMGMLTQINVTFKSVSTTEDILWLGIKVLFWFPFCLLCPETHFGVVNYTCIEPEDGQIKDRQMQIVFKLCENDIL